MPTYTFKCTNCQKEFELNISMDKIAKAKPTCPKCKSRLKRVYDFQTQAGAKKTKPTCTTGTCPFA